MTEGLFLDEDDIRKLTGFAHKARQVEQLRRMGIPFWVNGRGAPVVARAAVEGTKAEAKPKPKEEWVPRVLRKWTE